MSDYKVGDYVEVSGVGDVPSGRHIIDRIHKGSFGMYVNGYLHEYICIKRTCPCGHSVKKVPGVYKVNVSAIHTNVESFSISLADVADYDPLTGTVTLADELECKCESLLVGHDANCAWKASQ